VVALQYENGAIGTLTPANGYGGQQWHQEGGKDFVAAAHQRPEPAVTVDDALRTLRVIQARYESSQTGRRITLSRARFSTIGRKGLWQLSDSRSMEACPFALVHSELRTISARKTLRRSSQ